MSPFVLQLQGKGGVNINVEKGSHIPLQEINKATDI